MTSALSVPLPLPTRYRYSELPLSLSLPLPSQTLYSYSSVYKRVTVTLALPLRTSGGSERTTATVTRVFADNVVGLGFLKSVASIKPIPTGEKLFAVGKSGPKCHFLT